MKMPIRAFWLMNLNISRVRAEQDLRALRVETYAQSTAKDITRFSERLIAETGETVKLRFDLSQESGRDETGIATLRALIGKRRKKSG
jgi:hypothetical protein